MINPICKVALSALAPLLFALPATAADLIPYDNGYIPRPYDSGSAGYPGYGPDRLYGAGPHNCGPYGAPLAGDGWQGPCVPSHPYPVVGLRNGPEGPYSYQGDYQAGPPHNDRYGDYPDQRGYRPDRQPLAIPPNDRYGEPSQRGYGAGPIPPPIAPGEYSSQRGYGPDRTVRYGGYPPQRGYGPTPTGDYSSQRGGYESGPPLSSALPRNDPYDPNSY